MFDIMRRATSNECAFAVIEFPSDDTYSTCSRRNQLSDKHGFKVGEEVTIKWSKNQVFEGVVVFAHGKSLIYFSWLKVITIILWNKKEEIEKYRFCLLFTYIITFTNNIMLWLVFTLKTIETSAWRKRKILLLNTLPEIALENTKVLLGLRRQKDGRRHQKVLQFPRRRKRYVWIIFCYAVQCPEPT